MAKAAVTAKPAEPAVPQDFEWADEPAATVRKIGTTTSPDVGRIMALPEPQNGKFARIFFAVPTVPATITDATEQDKWCKDEVRKMTNRFSGVIRRLSKKEPAKAYAIRATEHNGSLGVAVYRMNVPQATPAPTPTAA